MDHHGGECIQHLYTGGVVYAQIFFPFDAFGIVLLWSVWHCGVKGVR